MNYFKLILNINLSLMNDDDDDDFERTETNLIF
jgi:hypothetical protein